MKNLFKIFNFFIIGLAGLILSSCAADDSEMQKAINEKKCLPIEEVLDVRKVDEYSQISINDGGVQKGIIQWVYDKISSVIRTASQRVFEVISEDDEYLAVIRIMVTLTVMFYALAIMFGMAQASGYSALIFVIKILFIYIFATQWDVFQEYVIDTFEAFVDDMISFASGTFHDFKGATGGTDVPGESGSLFAEMDRMLSILWDFRVIKIIFALMFTGFTGFFWGLMLLGLIIIYLFAILTAVKVFLLALIARYVLYALGPIFLSLLLFNQTKSMFDAWAGQLIAFSLQPVFLFIFLGMFQMILSGFMTEIFLDKLGDPNRLVGTGGTTEGADTYCIKYEPLTEFYGQSLYFYRLCKKSSTGVEDCSDSGVKPTIPIDIWVILSCIILCYMMYSMIPWTVQIADKFGGGFVTLTQVPIQGFDRVQQSVGEAGQTIYKGIATAARPKSNNQQ